MTYPSNVLCILIAIRVTDYCTRGGQVARLQHIRDLVPFGVILQSSQDDSQSITSQLNVFFLMEGSFILSD
jgi:hypothetical protein